MSLLVKLCQSVFGKAWISVNSFAEAGWLTINQGVRFSGVVVDSSMLNRVANEGVEHIHSHSKSMSDEFRLSMDSVQIKKSYAILVATRCKLISIFTAQVCNITRDVGEIFGLVLTRFRLRPHAARQ